MPLAFEVDTGGTLTTSLISYWKLEEVSGTRVDTFGANDLDDINTVEQAVGIKGDAAQFVRANSEALRHIDNADLSVGDIDFSIAFWVYLDSKTGSQALFCKAGSTSSTA